MQAIVSTTTLELQQAVQTIRREQAAAEKVPA
jgi:hypothetical protein